MLRTWLQRSGNRPLSISVFIPHGAGFEELRIFMDIILPYSPRWKSLRLVQNNWPELLHNLTSEDVPLLEVLQMNSVSDHDSRFVSIPPNLRNLTLKQMLSDAPIPPRRWDRITSLCLESSRNFFNLDAGQVLELLEQCTNLQSCKLEFPVGAAGGPPLPVSSTSAAHQITLLHLSTLSLTADVIATSPFNIVRFLAALVLPSLRGLDLSGVSRDFSRTPVVSDALLALDELVCRSSCDVQTLRVQFAEGDPGALLRCLRRCSGLTSLNLVQPGFFDDDVEASDLASALRELGDLSLCPRLSQLRLANCDRTDEIHPILKALVEARCARANPNGAPLCTVELNLLRDSTLLTTEFAAAMHPSEVTISNPAGERFDSVRTATLGIQEIELKGGLRVD
ncbi:hypothetical protein GGX14DRAFT_627625 [Mycena pura]|uniref:F-box domain-containing protein n=1 Tax=Mycena pura TaxID=153505 RepID=A0AAD6YR45_9AGAR|nr:hypothetical protein GGX14DRAFT_627625 [Mycena pura]